MSCFDVSPYICTYDSGGNGSLPGGGNPDYSSLATWESASDNDLAAYSGPVILDCYDSQNHDDYIYISGATNVSATIYREIRSSANCAIPWAGKAGTGANIVGFAGLGPTLLMGEDYSRVTNLYVETINNVPGTIKAVEVLRSHKGYIFTNVVAKCVNNNATYTGTAFYTHKVYTCLFYNCIALDSDGYGFLLDCDWTSSICAAINCVAINNGGLGFAVASDYGNYYAFNCYAANNAGGDFQETYWDAPSGWNASKDNTADLGGTAGDNYKNGLDLLTSGDMDSDGLALADDLYANGDAGDRYGRNPYDDLTAAIDFDNFLTRSNFERGKDVLETNGAMPASARAGCLLSPNADDMKLKSVSFYFSSTHGAAFRLAVYQGGSVESGPAGATLIHDFGLTSTSGTNQWQTLSIADGSEPALAKNTLTWIALKYNNNNANDVNYGSLTGDFLGTGRWVSASLATDETTAYPSTWPADAGAYGTGNHYALKIGIIVADPAVIFADASSTNDIRGTARPNGTTADSAWNVGASQAGAGYTDPAGSGGFVFGGGVVEVTQAAYTDPAMTGGIVFGGEAVSGGGEDEIHLVDGTASGGIVFGGEVEEQWKAEPNNMVAVKGGTYRISGDLYTLSNSMSYPGLGDIAALVYCDLAPTTVGYYRYDLLSIGAAGTITVTAGTEAATPVMPSLPAGEIKVNHVLRYYGQTSIEQADIGKLYNVPTLATITATVTDDELAWGQNSTAITIKCYDQYGALYTGSKSVTATISSGNGTVSPTTKSGTASSLSFTYTRGTESPMIEFASPAGPMTTVFIKLYDSNGDLMMTP